MIIKQDTYSIGDKVRIVELEALRKCRYSNKFDALYKTMEGHRFGHLIAKSISGKGKDNSTLWLCECDCGVQKIVRTSSLRSGNVTSCGCNQINNRNHTTHGLSKTPLHSVWLGMRKRCYNPQRSDYKYYGERGITVCNEWISDFATFYKWAENNGYKKGLTIDRIDTNGNYCPENCRWIPFQKQFQNRRNTKWIEINGRVQSLAEWCREYNLNYGRIKTHLWLHPELDKDQHLLQCIERESRKEVFA